jgi:glutaredoxin 3
MQPVTVYSSPYCPYCFMAKKLLSSKGVDFEEIDVVGAPERKAEMVERAGGRRTVPQIFIGETHVGGNDELQALEREGRLDGMLGAAA